MRLTIRLLLLTLVATVLPQFSAACTCSAAISAMSKTRLDKAKLEVATAGAIFEGTVTQIGLNWNAEKGHLGWLSLSDEGLYTVVVFKVIRKYKGDVPDEVEITTGLGYGDCGREFEAGVTYLVFAYADGPKKLSDGICSSTSSIDSIELGPTLRLLRNERPIASDYNRLQTAEELQAAFEAMPDAEKQRISDRFGKICGQIAADDIALHFHGRVAFLSSSGFGPLQYPFADIGADGSYCSPPLAPGKYVLYLMGLDKWYREPTSTIFYPAAVDHTSAVEVEVSGGKTLRDVNFTAPAKPTNHVLVVVNGTNGVEPGDLAVSLVPLHEPWFLPDEVNRPVKKGARAISPQRSFVDFENIPSGHYLAFIRGSHSGVESTWLTKKKIIEVNGDTTVEIEARSLQ
jgi:hypothetical protein